MTHIATVFGGSGFIGRYVVNRLARAGHVVRVAVRDPEAALFLKPMGRVGQVVPLYADVRREGTVRRALEGTGLVVNLVGILAERAAGDFNRLQGEAPGVIARIATEVGVSRVVHVSAIGADLGSESQYARSKAAGEAALRAGFPAATILRPSLVFGPEDKFYNRFASLARLLPFMPVIAGNSRFQPVYVGDVADAVLRALSDAGTIGLTYELGGPKVWTFREILAWILLTTQRPLPLVDIPMGVARLQASVAERLPGKPFTRDQLLMLGRDNVADAALPGLAQLGIIATPVDAVVPGYIAQYRPGGGRKPVFPTKLGPLRT